MIYSEIFFSISVCSYLRDAVLADNKKLLKIGVGVIGIAGVGFIIYKLVKSTKS